MILLDTTVLVYAVGTEHPLRSPSRTLVELVRDGTVRATTTVEVVQGFALVRFRPQPRTEAATRARRYAVGLSPRVRPEQEDLLDGLDLFGRSKGLGAFDSVLAATALRRGWALVSADRSFSHVHGLFSLDPSSATFLDHMQGSDIWLRRPLVAARRRQRRRAPAPRAERRGCACEHTRECLPSEDRRSSPRRPRGSPTGHRKRRSPPTPLLTRGTCARRSPNARSRGRGRSAPGPQPHGDGARRPCGARARTPAPREGAGPRPGLRDLPAQGGRHRLRAVRRGEVAREAGARHQRRLTTGAGLAEGSEAERTRSARRAPPCATRANVHPGADAQKGPLRAPSAVQLPQPVGAADIGACRTMGTAIGPPASGR